MTYEEEILKNFSTPGLKKSNLESPAHEPPPEHAAESTGVGSDPNLVEVTFVLNGHKHTYPIPRDCLIRAVQITTPVNFTSRGVGSREDLVDRNSNEGGN